MKLFLHNFHQRVYRQDDPDLGEARIFRGAIEDLIRRS